MHRPETAASLTDANFTKLRSIIHANTGITIGESRKTMLLGRLRSRLRETDEPDFKAYIERVETDKKELQELINRVTTNKTYFYRTPRIWNYFRNVLQPEFAAKKQKRPMRIWSGASSTGEEAHTIGVVLEHVRQTTPDFDYFVLGTDISSRVLELAERGQYASAALNAFRQEEPDLVKTYMTGDDVDGFRATPQIKSRLKFKLHNLQEKLQGASAFDVVFLRNVLIYFTHEDQEAILRHVRAAMHEDGALIIGESETLTQLDVPFDMVEPMIYRPKEAAS